MIYPALKTLHLLALISWMAGMLYLPRLFVYHAEAGPGTPQSETFKVMERRLLKAILTPAMVATWIFGLWLAWEIGALREGWLHAKLALVLALTGIHGLLAGAVRRFAEDRNTRTPRYWRIVNEIPALLMVGIVVLVVFKPF